MSWTKPTMKEVSLSFEVTSYVNTAKETKTSK